MEVWRTQPDVFLHDILERAASTILSPKIPPEMQHPQACLNAMRYRLQIIQVGSLLVPSSYVNTVPTSALQLQFAAWSKAVAFFRECDKLGLSGPTAVLRACKDDNTLMGRLVTMVCYVTERAYTMLATYANRSPISPHTLVKMWLMPKLPQVLTSGENLRPYFLRTRVKFPLHVASLRSSLIDGRLAGHGRESPCGHQLRILSCSQTKTWLDRGVSDRHLCRRRTNKDGRRLYDGNALSVPGEFIRLASTTRIS